jgi:hypothetical protein
MDNSMRFADSFVLLQQEGYLIRTSLAQGLTALRNANLSDKGLYYAAFFGLSIGIERLLKVILILDHMARNSLNAPPTSTLRRQAGRTGHDLRALFAAAESIQSPRDPHPLAFMRPQTLEHDILTHLSDFAEACGRYADLDALSTNRPPADPLARWKDITSMILAIDVPQRSKRLARSKATAVSTALADSAKVIAFDLDKRQLSVHEWVETPMMQDLAAARAVVRVLRILSPLADFLEEVNERALNTVRRLAPHEPGVPFMREFFIYLTVDESVALRKKRWP